MYIIIAGLTALMLCSSVMMGVPVAKAAEGIDTEAKISELTAKIAVLQSLLTKLLAGAGATATSTPLEGEMKGPIIPLGTVVTLTAGIQVRSDAGGRDTLLGVQATGTAGTIVAGPVKANEHIWYQVDFATGIDGWCLASGLLAKSNVKAMLPRPERPATTTLGEGLKNEMGIPARLEYLRTKLASTTSPIAQQKINELITKLLKQQASNTGLWMSKATSTLDGLRKPRASTTVPFRLRHQGTSTLEQSEVGTSGTSTVNGVVLGASTDVFNEIAGTLTTISSLLRSGVVSN